MSVLSTLQPGYRVGNYRLERKLGVGGCGEVWLGRHLNLANKEVAIKFLLNPLGGGGVERFQQEAAILDKLRSNPHIVRAEDFGEQDGIPYLMLEYAARGSLPEDTSLPLFRVSDYLQQIANSLDFAHQHNIIHRDLKPSNILFREDGTIALADFGIARDIDTRLTQSGTIFGTADYMSPEQFLDTAKVDKASDVYSLGVVVFEILTGSLPFTGNSPGEIEMAHRNSPLPQIQTYDPSLPASLQRVMEKALAKDPAERYQSAGEFYKAFKQALDAASNITPTFIRGPLAKTFTSGPARSLGRSFFLGLVYSLFWSVPLLLISLGGLANFFLPSTNLTEKLAQSELLQNLSLFDSEQVIIAGIIGLVALCLTLWFASQPGRRAIKGVLGIVVTFLVCVVGSAIGIAAGALVVAFLGFLRA